MDWSNVHTNRFKLLSPQYQQERNNKKRDGLNLIVQVLVVIVGMRSGISRRSFVGAVGMVS
jgi:hypothetical protein